MFAMQHYHRHCCHSINDNSWSWSEQNSNELVNPSIVPAWPISEQDGSLPMNVDVQCIQEEMHLVSARAPVARKELLKCNGTCLRVATSRPVPSLCCLFHSLFCSYILSQPNLVYNSTCLLCSQRSKWIGHWIVDFVGNRLSSTMVNIPTILHIGYRHTILVLVHTNADGARMHTHHVNNHWFVLHALKMVICLPRARTHILASHTPAFVPSSSQTVLAFELVPHLFHVLNGLADSYAHMYSMHLWTI